MCVFIQRQCLFYAAEQNCRDEGMTYLYSFIFSFFFSPTMSIMRCSNGAVENTAVCLRDLDKELFSTLKIFTVLD